MWLSRLIHSYDVLQKEDTAPAVEGISSRTAVDTPRDTKVSPFSYRSSLMLMSECIRYDNFHWRGLPCPFSPASSLGSGSRLGPLIAKQKIPRVSRVLLVPHFPFLLIHQAASFFTCMSIAVCLREAL